VELLFLASVIALAHNVSHAYLAVGYLQSTAE
jgi:hypothetical protein